MDGTFRSDLRQASPVNQAMWHFDEVFVSSAGRQISLWRAVDVEGQVLDVLVQARPGKDAALSLMRKLLKRQDRPPTAIIPDRYRAYHCTLRYLGLSHLHCRGKRLNDRAERSHVPIRRREQKMQSLRSAGSAQRFLSSHAAVYITFNIVRHLTTSTHWILREEAFDAWTMSVAAIA